MLEGEAAALAAERRSDADLATMATAIEEMAEGLDDRDAYASADVRFHVAVAEATGNRVALHAMHAIRDLLERALEQVYGIPGSAARSLEQHRQILASIEEGDSEEARTPYAHPPHACRARDPRRGHLEPDRRLRDTALSARREGVATWRGSASLDWA